MLKQAGPQLLELKPRPPFSKKPLRGTDGKGQPVRGQLIVELPTGYRRLNRCHTGFIVNRNLLEATQINQQALIAKRETGATMPSAAHRDFHVMSARKSHRFDNIMLSRNLYDQLRVARG